MTSNAPRPPRTLKQRIRFVLSASLFVLVSGVLIVPFMVGFIFIWVLTHGGCNGNENPAAFGIEDYEQVTFHSSTLNDAQGQPLPIRAYFIPGENRNGVTIIVPPTGGAGMGGTRMQEFVVMVRAGYSILTFESRACMGLSAYSLGYLEVNEVGDALAYLDTRPDMNMEQVGIFGFSSAGATSVMAGARYPQLRAVIAEGGYEDFGGELENNLRGQWFRVPYLLGVHLAYRLSTGEDMSVLSPLTVIPDIAPRPVLLIYGTLEPSHDGAVLQQAAGGPNVELWTVEGATHGSYILTAPEEFERRVIEFLDRVFGVTRAA